MQPKRDFSISKVVPSLVLLFFMLGAVSAAITQDFSTVGETVFQVPSYIKQITVTAYGAQGGTGSYVDPGVGGLGGMVQATLDVTPGDTLYFRVGGKGQTSGTNGSPLGGYNGGGAADFDCHCGSTYPGGGGGGASDVRYGNNSLQARVIVAGGGGGGSNGKYRNGPGPNPSGGAGGGLVGGTGGGTKGATGGSQTEGGNSSGGTAFWVIGDFGFGAHANAYFGSVAGGGGGGYWGGGGGGILVLGSWEAGGGGGGSSYTDPSRTTNVVHNQGVRSGDGFITISYRYPTTTSLTSSANPSNVGNAVTFTATVTGWNVTGMVYFYTNDSLLENVTMSGSTSATFTTTSLVGGYHTIWASYQGDNLNNPSDSSSVVQTVYPLPTTATTTTTAPTTTTKPITTTAQQTTTKPLATTTTTKPSTTTTAPQGTTTQATTTTPAPTTTTTTGGSSNSTTSGGENPEPQGSAASSAYNNWLSILLEYF